VIFVSLSSLDADVAAGLASGIFGVAAFSNTTSVSANITKIPNILND
jgi:hypothetical protein